MIDLARKGLNFVTPAKAGVQLNTLDSGLRRNDSSINFGQDTGQ
jgi:hypothetical protein